MPITVDILNNKHYSSHPHRQSYQLIIQVIIVTMLPSDVISLNQFNHFRAYSAQTNAVIPPLFENSFANQ